MLWLERKRCTAQPLLPARSLSATYVSFASTSPIPFWAPCAMIPVTLAPSVPCSSMPPPYSPNTSGRAGSSRSSGVGALRGRSQHLPPAARDVDAAHPVIAPALEPQAEAIPPDDAAQDGHPVHAPARDADADVALGDGIAALDA